MRRLDCLVFFMCMLNVAVAQAFDYSGDFSDKEKCLDKDYVKSVDVNYNLQNKIKVVFNGGDKYVVLSDIESKHAVLYMSHIQFAMQNNLPVSGYCNKDSNELYQINY